MINSQINNFFKIIRKNLEDLKNKDEIIGFFGIIEIFLKKTNRSNYSTSKRDKRGKGIKDICRTEEKVAVVRRGNKFGGLVVEMIYGDGGFLLLVEEKLSCKFSSSFHKKNPSKLNGCEDTFFL